MEEDEEEREEEEQVSEKEEEGERVEGGAVREARTGCKITEKKEGI